MTTEERIDALEARIAELEERLNSEHNQLVENRARIEANSRQIHSNGKVIEENISRLEQHKAALSEHEKHIRKHHEGLMEIMTNAAYSGTRDYLTGFTDPAAKPEDIPDPAKHEGPGVLERMTNEEAKSQETIVENWLEYGAAELNGEKEN